MRQRYILTHSESFETSLTYPSSTHYLIYQLAQNSCNAMIKICQAFKQFMHQNYCGGLHRLSSLLKNENLSLQRDLVNTSVIYFYVSTKWSSSSFLLTSSLMKWCLISMYLVWECWIRFLVKEIALVLSHIMGTQLRLTW